MPRLKKGDVICVHKIKFRVVNASAYKAFCDRMYWAWQHHWDSKAVENHMLSKLKEIGLEQVEDSNA